MKYWTVIVQDSGFGTDYTVSGEFAEEIHAKIFRNGFAAAHDLYSGNQNQYVMVAQHEDKS